MKSIAFHCVVVTVTLVMAAGFAVAGEPGEPRSEESELVTGGSSGGRGEPAVGHPREARSDEAITLEGYPRCRWGMSEEEVAAAFSEREMKTYHGERYFVDQVGGSRSFVTFIFAPEGLARVEVRVKPLRTRGRQMVEQFAKLEDWLVHRYGPPARRVRRGSDAPYIADWLAILLGEGAYATKWRGRDTELHLLLTGDGDELLLNIVYSNPALNSRVARREEEAAIQQF